MVFALIDVKKIKGEQNNKYLRKMFKIEVRVKYEGSLFSSFL